MRLTQIVFGVFKKKGIAGQPFKFVKRTPGKVDIGKHRIVPDLKPGHKLRMWDRMATEEENMMYLSKPYLSNAEEKHLQREFRVHGNRTFSKIECKEAAPLRSVYASEILEHLNVTRKWDV